MKKVIVFTDCGAVRGKEKDTCYEFLGIPYGQAKRFQPPQPVYWNGIRDCLAYGSMAAQPNYLGSKPAGVKFTLMGSEDCLNLNVWTKCVDTSAGLPVVIYIHGGAFQVGSNAVPERSGDRFMEDDNMVFVSVNYRLGVLGFLQLEDSYPAEYANSGNNGIRDLLLAIDWIYRNISTFGGDPSRITLMGVSAGAKAIGSLLTISRVRDICSQIYLESGAMQAFRSRKAAANITRHFREYLPKQADLLEMPLDTLIKAQADFCEKEGSTCYFGPVLDGQLFPEDSQQAAAQYCRWRGAALLGSGRNELFEMPRKPGFEKNREQILQRLFGSNGNIAQKAFEVLNQEMPDETACWTKVLSDFMYRSYTDRLAKTLYKKGNPVWVYSFEYFPAVHGMGFHFLMNQWNSPMLGLRESQYEEAKQISSYLRIAVRNFIHTGNPEGRDIHWAPYQGKYKLMLNAHPHMEAREEDSLTGFPDCVYQID